MFLTKKSIPRRTFIRGAGIAIGLPLLDSMIPAQTPLRNTAAAPVPRFLGIWHPHGAAPGYWSPLQEGKDFEFSFITKPLEQFRDRVTLITGLDMPEAAATTDEPGGDHARGAVFLCSSRPRRNAVSPYCGVSFDQLIAKKYGESTILSSIQLGVEEDGNFGNCNWGYSCAYTNCMSWTSPVTPLPTEVNPRVAFERLFGDGTSTEERIRGRKHSASILDSVAQEIAFFRRPLGEGDKQRLDAYLENIREIERRIRIAMESSIKEPSEEIPFGLPENKTVHYRLMYDLLALAFEGDLTRSATYMLGKDLSGASFPDSGFNGAWHGSSHHGDKPDNVSSYSKMNRYHVQNLAYFAEKLSKIPDGDGSVLDHTLIYKGSNMGNSHRHAHIKVPVILLGGLDGKFQGNRHIVFPDYVERTSNMLLALLHKYGIEDIPKYDIAGRQIGTQQSFGSSTGPLSL